MDNEPTFLFTPDVGPSVYEMGLLGAWNDPKDDNDLVESISARGGSANGADVCYDNSLTQSGSGRLNLGYIAAMRLYPDCLPGGAQERGDCVTWSTRNAVISSYANELLFGSNRDGLDAPRVSDDARLNGVIATESWYWFRGHSGEGWTCSAAAKVAMEKSGMWLRQNYEQFGFDLTKYSPSLAGRWGSSPPPQEIVEWGSKTLVKTTTFVRTYDELRDLIANGNCVSSCGSEAFVGNRNEDGLCVRSSKSWAHAMALLAVDDRPEMVAKYGCGLVLVQNSWGEGYLSGPRQIRNSAYSIPLGSFWAKWTDIRNRQMVAFSAVNGWPGRRMPNWGLTGIV